MENQDIDLIGQTVGNMPYKIGIVDQQGNLKNQFVANASTNRIDIPQSILGTGGSSTGGSTGGTTGGNTGGGTAQSPVPQLPTNVNIFSGSAVGDILLLGPTSNYDNVQDGLLITLSNVTSRVVDGTIPAGSYNLPKSMPSYDFRVDLSPSGLKTIKIPKEKLVVNSSFDISDQLSQYIGKTVQLQTTFDLNNWGPINNKFVFSIASFGGTTIKVLPNATLNMNLTVSLKENSSDLISKDMFPIPVIQVNDYKN